MGSEPLEHGKAVASGKRARLQAELQTTRELLRQERGRRLGAEARLAHALAQPEGETSGPAALRQRLQIETRQLELLQNLESQLAKLEDDWRQKPAVPARNGRQALIPTLLTALAGGLLGGGLVLALMPWHSGRLQNLGPGAVAPVAVLESGSGETPPGEAPPDQSEPEAGQAGETVQFRCNEPCWLDIREAESRKPVFANLHQGTAQFAVGRGLDVFSGRADLVKVQINNGAEEPFLPSGVVGSRVFRPSP